MAIDISVLIPTRNRRALLARTLPSVWQQDFPAERYEVIVAIDGSEDNTAGFLRTVRPACALRALDLPHGGRAAALNAALAVARGAVVLFLDDDLLCSPTLLREHWRAHADDVAVLGLVELAEESGDRLTAQLRRRGLAHYFASLAPGQNTAPFAFGHANSSVSRARLMAVHGFDESFVGSGEETDCGFRLWQSGIRCHLEPRAVTREIYAKSPAELVAHARGHGRNEWRLCAKHPAYRPYSRLERVREGAVWKQALRRWAVEFPLDLGCLVAPIIAISDRIGWFRSVGLRCLGAHMGLAFLRGARAAAGSWRELAGRSDRSAAASHSGEQATQESRQH